MSEALFQKVPSGALVPYDDYATELTSKMKIGRPVSVKLTRIRNPNFHRKFMALLRLGFDYWEPPEADIPAHIAQALKHRGEAVNKTFEGFRKDVVILAGYYDAYVRLNGETRLEAKSISFGSMDEDTFEKLYSDVIDVILKRVCTQYTEAELRRQVEDMVLSYV